MRKRKWWFAALALALVSCRTAPAPDVTHSLVGDYWEPGRMHATSDDRAHIATLLRKIDAYPSYSLLCLTYEKKRLDPLVKIRTDRVRRPLTLLSLYEGTYELRLTSTSKLVDLAKHIDLAMGKKLDPALRMVWDDRHEKVEHLLDVLFKWPNQFGSKWTLSKSGRLHLADVSSMAGRPYTGGMRDIADMADAAVKLKLPRRSLVSCNPSGLLVGKRLR